MAVALTEKAAKQVKQLMKAQNLENVYLRMGVKGGGAPGCRTRSSSTTRSAPTTRSSRWTACTVVCDAKSYIYPERHDAGLRDGRVDGRLHLRQSQREIELWLWHLVLRVGPGRWRSVEHGAIRQDGRDTENGPRRARSHFDGGDERLFRGLRASPEAPGGRRGAAAALLRAVAPAPPGLPSARGARPSRRRPSRESALVNRAYRALRDPIAPRGVPRGARGGT